MGEATADTRRQIDETREALTGTLHELRVRGRRARQVGMRVAVSAAAAGVFAGAAVTTAVVVVRRRDAGPLTRGSKRLPSPAREVAAPTARRADRWLGRRGKRLRSERDHLVDQVAARIAQQYALIERRSNPRWRRTLLRAAEAAASAAATAAVQQVLNRRLRADRQGAGESMEVRDSSRVGVAAG